MRKGRFALVSRFNDFHTNPCIFLSFQTALKVFLGGLTVRKFPPLHIYFAYLTLGKNRNLSSGFGLSYGKFH